MSKKSVRLSNLAHERLRNKNFINYEKTGSKSSMKKQLYHFKVIDLQMKNNRKLTKTEKQKLFKDIDKS